MVEVMDCTVVERGEKVVWIDSAVSGAAEFTFAVSVVGSSVMANVTTPVGAGDGGGGGAVAEAGGEVSTTVVGTDVGPGVAATGFPVVGRVEVGAGVGALVAGKSSLKTP